MEPNVLAESQAIQEIAKIVTGTALDENSEPLEGTSIEDL